MDLPSHLDPPFDFAHASESPSDPLGELNTAISWPTDDAPLDWDVIDNIPLDDEDNRWPAWMTSDSTYPNETANIAQDYSFPPHPDAPPDIIQPSETVITNPPPPPPPVLLSPSPSRKNHYLSDVTQWLDGAYSPPVPCSYCRRHRLQCLIIRTGVANPNPVTSCSSCVALFRECSLARGEKRQPSGFETLSPVLGNLHGLREQTENAIPENPESPILTWEPESHYAHPTANIAAAGSIVSETRHEPSQAPSSESKDSKQFVRRGARVLRTWLAQNQDYPYPSEEDKTHLAQETGFSRKRISTWFANARRRQKHKADSAIAATEAQRIHRAGSPMPIPSSSSDQWTSMTPLERWQASPPEDDPVPESAIKDAIAANSSSVDLLNDEIGLFDDTASSCVSSSASRGGGPIRTARVGSQRGSSASASSISSSTSAAWSHHSFSDSGLPVHSQASPSHRSHRYHPHRRRPSSSSTSTTQNRNKLQYQCTFCPQSFKKKTDWYRHETTIHLALDTWICTPSISDLLPFNTTTSQAPFSEQGQTCPFCALPSPPPTHWDEHDFPTCAAKPHSERSFTRKDHLWQHLRKFHGCTKFPLTQGLEAWRRDETREQLRSRCGFCGREMSSWAERGEHLAEHFRRGERLEGGWNGGLGFDEAVLARVRY